MSLHIYRTNAQPFTRWRIGTNILPKPSRWFTNHPRSQHVCENCYRRRTAANLAIYVYYDYCKVVCSPKCEPSTYRERYARLRRLRAANPTTEGREP